MAGLLSEFRKMLSGNRLKSTYSSNVVRRSEPRIVKQVPVMQEQLQPHPEPPDDTEDSFFEAPEQCRTSIYERTQDIVNKDDFLLQQIDEFRDRAQQLQNLMNSREEELRKMEEARQMEAERQQELEELRRQEEERQRQLEELRQQEEERQQELEELRQQEEERQQELEELRQLQEQSEQAAGISEDQMQRIEQLLLKRDENAQRQAAGLQEDQMQQIEQILLKRDENAQRQEAGLHANQMQQIEQILLKRDENTEKLTAEVERRIDAMIAKVGAKLDELDASVRESTAGENSASKQRAAELKESLEQIQTQLEGLKAELSDKVHKENVICYRNIQELFKDLETKVDRVARLEPIKRKLDSSRSLSIISLIFGVVNFLGIVGMLLLQLGAFTI